MDVRRDKLIIPQGTYWGWTWRVRGADGTPVADFSGWSAHAQARPTIDSPTVLHEWSSASGNIVFSPPYVTLLVFDYESTAWDWVDAVYDIELTDPGSRVARIAEGDIWVSRETTRTT